MHVNRAFEQLEERTCIAYRIDHSSFSSSTVGRRPGFVYHLGKEGGREEGSESETEERREGGREGGRDSVPQT